MTAPVTTDLPPTAPEASASAAGPATDAVQPGGGGADVTATGAAEVVPEAGADGPVASEAVAAADGDAAVRDGATEGSATPADAPVSAERAAPDRPARARRPAADDGTPATSRAPRPRRPSGDGQPPHGRSGGRSGTQRGFPRAEHPAPVPTPDHVHLPGWVRRAHARARGPLGDLLALLQGDERDALHRRVDELTAGISSGRFSLAWQYPDVIEEGRAAFERQRSTIAETQRATRQLETARRRAGDRLRDAAATLPADAASRLQRALRSAGDAAAIAAVEAEADQALSQARSSGARRRDREIERTRARILNAVPRSAAVPEQPAESWQDVLRRFAEEQQAADG